MIVFWFDFFFIIYVFFPITVEKSCVRIILSLLFFFFSFFNFEKSKIGYWKKVGYIGLFFYNLIFVFSPTKPKMNKKKKWRYFFPSPPLHFFFFPCFDFWLKTSNHTYTTFYISFFFYPFFLTHSPIQITLFYLLLTHAFNLKKKNKGVI